MLVALRQSAVGCAIRTIEAIDLGRVCTVSGNYVLTVKAALKVRSNPAPHDTHDSRLPLCQTAV